jgi:hypothetical protein
MIAKCPCEHCGVNIEFATEEFLSGSAVTCPHCGKETPLYVSQQAKPVPKPAVPISTPQERQLSSAESLKLIRQQTCYKTLRSLIDMVQILFFVAAGLLAIGSIGVLFEGSEELQAAAKITSLIIGLVLAFILTVLAIAWKQAALLLVDIADCQIRLVGNKA